MAVGRSSASTTHFGVTRRRGLPPPPPAPPPSPPPRRFFRPPPPPPPTRLLCLGNPCTAAWLRGFFCLPTLYVPHSMPVAASACRCALSVVFRHRGTSGHDDRIVLGSEDLTRKRQATLAPSHSLFDLWRAVPLPVERLLLRTAARSRPSSLFGRSGRPLRPRTAYGAAAGEHHARRGEALTSSQCLDSFVLLLVTCFCRLEDASRWARPSWAPLRRSRPRVVADRSPRLLLPGSRRAGYAASLSRPLATLVCSCCFDTSSRFAVLPALSLAGASASAPADTAPYTQHPISTSRSTTRDRC